MFVLISIEDKEQQYAIAQKIFDEKLSVRDVEKLVKDMNKPVKEKKEVKKIRVWKLFIGI